jgi:Uma2 family endonuclease
MATATRNPARVVGEGLTPYRLTVRQFEQMIKAGILTADDRVELLGGILAEQMTKNAPHDFTIGHLAKVLEALIGPDWVVREEKAVVLGRFWRPEPDLAVARGPLDRYRRAQPTTKELAFLVEVAESTYPADRGEKWQGYAAARVPAYWIVNLDDRRVEVYSDPFGRGGNARFRSAVTSGPGDAVPVVLAGRVIGQVAVNDILP